MPLASKTWTNANMRTTVPCAGFIGIIVVVIGGVSDATAASANVVPQRPNIVLIMADDVGTEYFGCYGYTGIRTPHIDRMAREGVMFKTAWATPMCSPTRAMIMTGRYANRTGFYHNQLKLFGPGEPVNLLEQNLTFGRLLKDAGYATAIAGKWHVTGDELHEPTGGFEEYSLWEGTRQLA